MPSPVPQPKRYVARVDRVAARFAQLPSEVQRLIRLCDGSRSLAQLRTDSGLPQRVFSQVLGKLVTLELISPFERRQADRARALAWVHGWPLRSPAISPPPEPELDSDPMPGLVEQSPLGLRPELELPCELACDFSDDEEAFFARTIEHLLEPEERVLAIA